MSFVGLALCLTLLAYGVSMSAGSALILPFLWAALQIFDPDTRSRRLLALRFLPAILAAFVALGLVLPAFLWLEPRPTNERLGTTLVLLAALSGAVLLGGVVRGGLALLATRRQIRRWNDSARPIHLYGIRLPTFAVDEPFPLVTIVGCMRQRVIVSRIVLERCTEAELSAIAAHESGHLRRGDPWKRMLLRAFPDLLALTPLGATLQRRWEEAAEHAADDHASSDGAGRSLDLAEALLKVARLAGTSTPRGLPPTALYRGGGVAERVARLIERSQTPVGAHRGQSELASISLVVCLLFIPAAAHIGLFDRVHCLLETIVALLR